MTTTLVHQIDWVAPSPLWTTDATVMQRPTLLQFGAETFMDDLAKALTPRVPAGTIDLSPLVARFETHAEREPGADPPTDADLQSRTLKLYQPAHGRFYLVAASLVCRLPGMPDLALDLAGGDKVTFLLRRILDGQEQAWNGTGWIPITGEPRLVVTGEQEMPLSPLTFTDARGVRRRLLVGFIPTSSRETFDAAGLADPEAVPGLDEATTRIFAPLSDLQALGGTLDRTDAASVTRLQEASRFLLIDMADYLKTRLPALWTAIDAQTEPAAATDRAVYALLAGTAAGTIAGQSVTWLQAIDAAWAQRDKIIDSAEPPDASLIDIDLSGSPMQVASLHDAISAALTATAASAAPPDDDHRQLLPKIDETDPTAQPAQYAIRCVLRRGRCAPLRNDRVSQPSAPFQIAPFFDPDAPARPIRIALPLDTSIAGLRKFKKNVAFIFSKNLGDQISRSQDLNKLLKGQMDSGQPFGLGLGQICSFSIPIITLCATIVLMIFISLLNIVFWWIPFLKICLPIPTRRR
jgi:hypothetical protein